MVSLAVFPHDFNPGTAQPVGRCAPVPGQVQGHDCTQDCKLQQARQGIALAHLYKLSWPI